MEEDRGRIGRTTLADKHEYIVVTKDSDFKISHFVQGKPQRVLKINLGNIPTLRLIEILEENFEIISDQFKDPRRFVEIGGGYLETL